MSRIAVIGSGISGLAAAWLLSRRFDVLLLERADRLGGHTHTHHLDTPDGPLALDTGFLVHNDRTYPLLVRLFRELGVACLDSDMSFGVSCPRTGFEYSTRNLNGLFAQRRTSLRPSHYALLAEILRFNRASQRFAAAAAADGAAARPASRCLADRQPLLGRVSRTVPVSAGRLDLVRRPSTRFASSRPSRSFASSTSTA